MIDLREVRERRGVSAAGAQLRPRRLLLVAAAGLTMLLLPAAAQAQSSTASAGGTTATLAYGNGAEKSASTTGMQLLITRKGKRVYQQPVPSKGCAKVCTPGSQHPVAVASLYGDGSQDVVLALHRQDAFPPCCNVADVYVPSAATHSYVLDQYDFGAATFTLQNIGPRGRPEFVTGDTRFYCLVSQCAGSALPLQILQFNAESFVNVTKSYPKLIGADAAHWYKFYFEEPKQRIAAIVAWAADEYNLGHAAAARVVLKHQVAHGYMKASVEAGTERFLEINHYH